MSSHSRRLEDRIRDLCARVVSAKDPEELNLVLPQLKTAIHQAIERVRTKAVAVLGSSRALPKDRRKIS
jgi:hypothetical protein